MKEKFLKYLPENDIYLFNIGQAQKAYEFFGCHYIHELKMHRFCVWAPNARNISLVGDFNSWNAAETPMELYKNGVWVCFVPGLKDGENYKYMVHGYDGSTVLKADPFAFHSEVRPQTASKVWDLGGYEWHDDKYVQRRIKKNVLENPVSIYELHIGSWRTKEGYRFPSFREVADELADYVNDMGYTHIELMPVAEHPFDGSWGYQVTGFYAVTSRYGTPQDFMYFVDKMHSRGIGVIIDWVPGHFPKDAQGLAKFDGTHLYEHENVLQREHPQWGTLIFNYGRPEVVSFLVSNAVFFMDQFHIDGLRVDAVTSILYLDYARDGYFVPNEEGGNIDNHAVEMLRRVNSVVLTKYAGTMTIAEESTAYPMITKPPYDGGLGFTFKWNMGFMHDTLAYMSMDHYFRQFDHNKMTFSMFYAFRENYILAYSHDEVVHGKKSMVDKMFGDYWQKFASLRALYSFMFAHPGKKLMFMGDEFAQFIEWDYKKQLDWFLLEYESHAGMQKFVKELNEVYTGNPALYRIDDSWEGFTWLNVDDAERSTFAFMRSAGEERIICVVNFTPVVRENYWVAIPQEGKLELLLNSDEKKYGGSGVGPEQIIKTQKRGINKMDYSAAMTLPPLGAVYYKFTLKK
ncbi:MAG: 1,4-alpha-glucan branching protein GlgB [Christensenella hongkongensis]|uniref:1,4-alpha-glucan branching protein GlgB n=1 Tax=Christensenella hongkongensis TaxID=270498 RepID=UPI002672C923|nr:1,4-alpha-glucan branching protein GlgB [Christensenella hongkongensis]MDY3004863.1 1,4-alpha-glucan branching protein GlgB [Christensenella hongkongensis]